MTLHWTIIQKSRLDKKCKICSINVRDIDLYEHFSNCYDKKIKTLFDNFDSEISKIKLFYNNELKLLKLKKIINLSELCEKCEFFQEPRIQIKNHF
jgi:hypothetical protein